VQLGRLSMFDRSDAQSTARYLAEYDETLYTLSQDIRKKHYLRRSVSGKEGIDSQPVCAPHQSGNRLS